MADRGERLGVGEHCCALLTFYTTVSHLSQKALLVKIAPSVPWAVRFTVALY